METYMQNRSTKTATLDMDKWHEIIESWDKSGETQKDYCQRLGVSLNTFSYARSKLLQQIKPKTQFIPVTVKNHSEEKNAPSSIIVLENRRGYKLHFSVALSLEQIVKIFKLSGWNDA
jgi:hypothetical protein